MKKTIAFEKDITFKTKIGEITAISLDNDLTLRGENTIVGNFYISGSYKMLETSTAQEEYSYKIPCEIAISDEYDTYDSSIDIDDFTYEIINNEILRINIEVVINNLERKEEVDNTLIVNEDVGDVDKSFTYESDNIKNNLFYNEDEREEIKELIEEINNNEKIEDSDEADEYKSQTIPSEKVEILDELPKIDDVRPSFMEVEKSIKNEEDTYLTYSVYIYKEDDSIEKILEKYNITKDALEDYNDLDKLVSGCKLVIPSFNDKL